jgi:integrase
MAKRGHGEGSNYREKDGTWRAALSLSPEEGGGRRYFRGQTRQEVQQKLAAARRAQEDGLPLVTGRQTVEQYLTTWLEAIKPTMDYSAWKRHSEHVRLHIIPGLGAIRLTSLTPQHVQILYSDRLSSGLSPSTVHHLHATLHKALKDAERLRLVARMAESEIHPLSRDEARGLLDIASSERLYALYALALATGMRQSELLGLQWPELALP